MIHWEIICWSLYEAHGDAHCVNETFVVQRKNPKILSRVLMPCSPANNSAHGTQQGSQISF